MELAPEVKTGKKPEAKATDKKDFRIPLDVVAGQPLLFTVECEPTNLNETLLKLQAPVIEGLIPLFKVRAVHEVRIVHMDVVEAKNVVKSMFQVVMETTYGVFDAGFTEYRAWLKESFQVDLEPHKKAFN